VPFIAAWSAIQHQLRPGTAVANWTAANGLLGDSFTISAVRPGHVEVDTPGAENIQTASMGDFEAVYNVWAPYCRGQVGRAEVVRTTRVSKYVISILRWIEEQNGGALP
jgi:hypothetical protein